MNRLPIFDSYSAKQELGAWVNLNFLLLFSIGKSSSFNDHYTTSYPDLPFPPLSRAFFISLSTSFTCKLMTILLRFTVSSDTTCIFPFSFNDHNSGGLVEEYQAMMKFSLKFMT